MSKHLSTQKKSLSRAIGEQNTLASIRNRMPVWWLGMVLPMAAGSAIAQEGNAPVQQDEIEAIEEIVVEGFRGVVRSSIETKRESMAIVDAISTDDIGNLPALSLSAVLETVTGAGSHREKGGGGTEISIRGLGPFLGATTFNGRQATNGSGDRSVNFNQFPSELANNIKIYKSQQADLVEGGVSGLTEIGSVRPLDFGKRRIQFDGKANYTPYGERLDNGESSGWRGTLSYMDQFGTDALGDIGLSLGIQRNEVTNPQERFFASSNWSACDATVVPTIDRNGRYSRCTDNTIDLDGANRNNAFYLVPNSFGLTQQGENDVREAVFSALQWQPNDRVDVNLDIQYSTREYDEDRHSLVFADSRRVGPDPVFNDKGALRYFEGTSMISSEGIYLTREEDYTGGGFNIEWDATERLNLSVDLAYSNTVRTTIQRRSRLRSDRFDIYGNPLAFADDNPRFSGDIPYTWDFRNGDVPSVTLDPRFDVTDHSLFSDDLQLLRDEERREHTIKAVRFDGAYDIDSGWLQSVQGGVRIGEMTFEDYKLRNQFVQTDAALDRAANEACRIDFPQSDFLKDADGNTIDSWATFNTLCLMEFYTGTRDIGLPDERRDTANRDVIERTYAAYAMANYSTVVGGLPLYGNAGIRLVQTEVTSKGLRSELSVEPVGDTGNVQLVPTGNFETVEYENDTFDVLPSINAILELRPDVLLRGAVYRALARPDPSGLGAGRDFRLNSDEGGFSSVEEAISEVTANGSPALEPLRAWNYDVSLEWYPNDDTILSAALYYKKFEGGMVPVVRNETFVVDGVSVTVPVAQTKTTDDTSDLTGIELTFAHSFTYLPAPFDGLGVKIGYNYADTNFESHDTRLGDRIDAVTGEVTKGIIAPADISGFSDQVLSAQLFYKIGALDLQTIYKYRSDYHQDFVGGNAMLRYVEDNDVVDFRASYRITRNLQLRFEALNLTNEPRVDNMPVPGSQRDYQIYGPTYYLGANVKF